MEIKNKREERKGGIRQNMIQLGKHKRRERDAKELTRKERKKKKEHAKQKTEKTLEDRMKEENEIRRQNEGSLISNSSYVSIEIFFGNYFEI